MNTWRAPATHHTHRIGDLLAEEEKACDNLQRKRSVESVTSWSVFYLKIHWPARAVECSCKLSVCCSSHPHLVLLKDGR